jgi:hypothetical protein
MMWMFLPLTFALTFLTTHPELSAYGCVVMACVPLISQSMGK